MPGIELNPKRKFLTRTLPDNLHCYHSAKIKLAFTGFNPDIRLKQMDERYYITVREKNQNSTHLLEMSIDEQQFKSLWDKKIAPVIEKTRFFIPLPGTLSSELDVYEGKLAPLMLTLVTFASQAQAQSFSPPRWLGKEVSREGAYRGSNLALKLKNLEEREA